MPGPLSPPRRSGHAGQPRHNAGRFQAALLAWAEGVRADLPWRRTRDPWAVLVSEVMLQQTQVARVVPVYVRFLDRFPTPSACAAAPLGEVVRAWAGLGYNRRAVNLHRLATTLDGDALPGDLAGLLALPGVGPYTARAVLAFSGQADVGVLDTNSARVLARAVVGRRLGTGEAQRVADGQVPPGRGWAWNSAVLDLGATVCTTRSPRCGDCPVAAECAWMRAGRPSPDPGAALRRQSTFAGSDRQGRGRLVDALRAGPVATTDIASVAGWPAEPERARRIVADLVSDGLAVVSRDGATVRLP